MSTASSSSVSKRGPTAGAGDQLPWSGDPRANDKTSVYKYLLNQPHGAPIPKIVEHLFGLTADDDQERYQTEYKFVRRFVDTAPIFRIDRGQDLLHVEPRPSAFHLTGGKNHSNGGAVGRFEKSLYEFPKDYARRYLGTVTELYPDRAAVVERQFVRYIGQIEDRWNILRKKDPNPGERPYALVPYSTLFNDEREAADNWRRYQEAWENATREHEEAVFVTLTTDPANFGSIHEMADATMENFNRLKSWLRRKLADRCPDVGTAGHRIGECPGCEQYADVPPYIKVLEWTEAGRPHLHVVFFGVDWLIPQAELSAYWGEKQAEVVDIRQVRRTRADRGGVELEDGTIWKWYSRNPKTGARKNEKAHLGKYLDKQMPAGESAAELEEQIGGEDGLWKTALYWATGKRFWTCSRSLKGEPAEGPVDLERYVYVGAANFDSIPNHVMRNARILDRPPPPGDGS